MSKHPAEINDDEIRVISPSHKGADSSDNDARRRRWPRVAIAAAALVVVAIAAIIYFAISDTDTEAPKEQEQPEQPQPEVPVVKAEEINIVESTGSVAIRDTIVGGVALQLLAPNNLTPSLHVGADVLADSTVKMVFQAADIRKDNGEIVGAYVLEGNLISKGQSKAGYCAITNGNLSMGVADATPMLEQAIETNGYFFRQYPLVVGGQIVENKPQGQSLRKALAEIGGRAYVVLTNQRLTFHEFSQALVDLGATNAIYLVGGSSPYGYARDGSGAKHEYGDPAAETTPYTNYIVWR